MKQQKRNRVVAGVQEFTSGLRVAAVVEARTDDVRVPAVAANAMGVREDTRGAALDEVAAVAIRDGDTRCAPSVAEVV
jgi:hypothetical protein